MRTLLVCLLTSSRLVDRNDGHTHISSGLVDTTFWTLILSSPFPNTQRLALPRRSLPHDNYCSVAPAKHSTASLNHVCSTRFQPADGCCCSTSSHCQNCHESLCFQTSRFKSIGYTAQRMHGPQLVRRRRVAIARRSLGHLAGHYATGSIIGA